MPAHRPTATAHVAIRHAVDGRLLVLPAGRFPVFEVDLAEPWQVVAGVAPSMRDQLGLEVVTLRPAWTSQSTDARLYEAIVVRGTPPGDTIWCEPGDLPTRLTAERPDLVRAVRGGALATIDGSHQPWYGPDWFQVMTAWADDRLVDAGLRRRGPFRQVRSWGRSALLQADTDRGLVWAKAVPHAFTHEIAVTGLLADLDPGLVPPVIAADTTHGRLLLANVDGPSLARVGEPTAWMATMARLAETQRVLAAERARLSVAGVATASLDSLAEAVPGLLADDELLGIGRPGGVTGAGHDRLLAEVDRIVDACRAMATSGVPDSLDHGDLRPDQVIVGAMGPVIFDWSDASITHPILSLESFVSGSSGALAPPRETLTQAYLDVWASPDTSDASAARDAAGRAWLVLPFHLARIHRDRVRPGLDQPWESEGVVPARLQRLADRLALGATG